MEMLYPENIYAQQLSDREKIIARHFFQIRKRKLSNTLTQEDSIFLEVLDLSKEIFNYLTQENLFSVTFSFDSILKKYIKLLHKTQKAIALELDYSEAFISKILKKQKAPTESMFIRLEKHSGHLITALDWMRLYEKEREYLLGKEVKRRQIEESHVRQGISVA